MAFQLTVILDVEGVAEDDLYPSDIAGAIAEQLQGEDIEVSTDDGDYLIQVADVSAGL